jgi:hypothetical protein
MSKPITANRVRAILVKARLHFKSSHLGATKVFETDGDILIVPAAGLFNLSRARRPQMMAALKAKGIEATEYDRHTAGALRISPRGAADQPSTQS